MKLTGYRKSETCETAIVNDFVYFGLDLSSILYNKNEYNAQSNHESSFSGMRGEKTIS